MEKGDCLSLMQQMDSGSVDHVIADPPYDAKTHANVKTMKGGEAGNIQLGFEALSNMAHVKEMLRVARRWVVCFCSLEQLGEYQMFSGDSWVRAGVWDRVNGAPQITGDRPGQGGEGIAIMYAGNGRMKWNGGGQRAMWRVPRANGEHHPTEKPILLMLQLVRLFTDYGDTILDPYAGSGTTGVAAVTLGRNFIGCEMLDKHRQTAINRLTATHEQMDLKTKPRRKAKQIKLIGGSDGKEESKEDEQGDEVDGEGEDVPDHRSRAGGEQAEVAGAREVPGSVDGGSGEQVDRSGEDDPFEETDDHTPGPEDLGEVEEIDADEDCPCGDH